MNCAEAIRRLGGPTAAAHRLGLKRPTVSMWLHVGTIPPRHALAVARALNVPVEEILPPPPTQAPEHEEIAA